MKCDLHQFTKWIEEIQEQPAWRSTADYEMDYYDGNQLDSEVLRQQREIGLPSAIENVTAPAIDSLTGMEVKQRKDWKVIPTDDEQGIDDRTKRGLGGKLHTAERESHADDSCSSGFFGLVTVGIGWVEVSRESDPFKYPYRCTPVHRNEIYWDMLAKRPDISDARYLVRRKWTGIEQAALLFPKHKKLIEATGSGWHGLDWQDITTDGGGSTSLSRSLDIERGWSVEEQEWRDIASERICLFEVWYRSWENVLVLKLRNGRVIEYDKNNPMHRQAVAIGVTLDKAIVGRVRLAWFLGPHQLHDGESPYKHGFFPYVPFWGKREDRTGVPYGLIRSIIFLQDEINARISKMQWGLGAIRTIRTEGAVVGEDEHFRQEVARPDADIILDAKHMSKPGAKFEVKRDFELNTQQYNRLQDARDAVERVTGVTDAFRGEGSKGQSGLAINSLIEQSVQGIAKMSANFETSRAMVGDLLLSLMLEDINGKLMELPVQAGPLGDDQPARVNVPTVDPETGTEYLTNDTSRMRLKCTLEDVPTTPSFRSQQLAALSEAFKSAPPEHQRVMMPQLLSLMDVPYKEELIKAIKDISVAPSEEDVEKRIADAVKKAVADQRFDLEERRIALMEKETAEKIAKIVEEKVNKRIESIYSAVQASREIAATPELSGVSDQILESAGFEDADAPPIVARPDRLDGPPPADDLSGSELPPENTSPMFPPRVQEPDIVTPEIDEQEQMNEADAGFQEGIEAQG